MGMVTLVKPLQPSNALSPISVTELPMVTIFKPVKLQHRLAGILSTSLPNSNVLMLVKPLNGRESYEKLLQFFAFQTTLVKPLQPLNALLSIEVTELPMVRLVKPLQSRNAQ